METKLDADFLAEQNADDSNKLKTKTLNKALQGKRVSEYLKKRRGAKRTAMDRDGVSRMELLQDLEPTVKTKSVNDLGVKAIAEFVKMRASLQVMLRGMECGLRLASLASPKGLLGACLLEACLLEASIP